MSLIISCPNCSKRYQVADKLGGKRVRCQQCGTDFTAATMAISPPAPLATTDMWTNADLSQLPALPASGPLRRGSAQAAGVSNPSGGPTDAQMRLVCCGMLTLAMVISVGSLAMEAAQGTVFLGIVVLVPLMLVLGATGLISPNVVRAIGKYGGHLPRHYKTIGWGVMGLSFLLMILLTICLFFAGFRPDRPGNRNQKPGLTRSQTTTVIERIRTSYEASLDANVVRKVSFPVFSIHAPNPEAEAERALSAAPGYVAGSFQISADRKTISFHYKGDKQIGSQYALLLPGPTGIYMSFCAGIQRIEVHQTQRRPALTAKYRLF